MWSGNSKAAYWKNVAKVTRGEGSAKVITKVAELAGSEGKG